MLVDRIKLVDRLVGINNFVLPSIPFPSSQNDRPRQLQRWECGRDDRLILLLAFFLAEIFGKTNLRLAPKSQTRRFSRCFRLQKCGFVAFL